MMWAVFTETLLILFSLAKTIVTVYFLMMPPQLWELFPGTKLRFEINSKILVGGRTWWVVGFIDEVGNGLSSKASKSCLSDKMVDHFVLLLLLMPPPTSLGKTLCDDLYDKKTQGGVAFVNMHYSHNYGQTSWQSSISEIILHNISVPKRQNPARLIFGKN